MNNLETAKELLKQGHTCVLVKDDKVLISDKTGISPMMDFIEKKENLSGFSVADKIVGKAVALLFALCNIKEVYAEVISKSAISVLEKYKIGYYYGELTEKIINRKGTGICPMEECVANIDDYDEAYKKLKEKLQTLKSKDKYGL